MSTKAKEIAKQRREAAQRFLALRDELHAMFPVAFPVKGQPRLPLAVGIDKTLRAVMGWSANQTRFFMSRWTRRPKYLRALTLCPHRIDLAGEPAGEITEEQRKHAATALAKREAWWTEREAKRKPEVRAHA